MWKAKHKSYILLVLLPTLLDGFVTAVHTAVLMIVNALRHLDGLVVSKSEAHHLGIEPGSYVVEKASIPYWRQELLRGFVLLEGSLPVATSRITPFFSLRASDLLPGHPEVDGHVVLRA